MGLLTLLELLKGEQLDGRAVEHDLGGERHGCFAGLALCLKGHLGVANLA